MKIRTLSALIFSIGIERTLVVYNKKVVLISRSIQLIILIYIIWFVV
jgi:hypothetical protein